MKSSNFLRSLLAFVMIVAISFAFYDGNANDKVEKTKLPSEVQKTTFDLNVGLNHTLEPIAITETRFAYSVQAVLTDNDFNFEAQKNYFVAIQDVALPRLASKTPLRHRPFTVYWRS